MKLTPQEQKVIENFKPGKISKNGFLGNDSRHIHEIIKADLLILSSLGITTQEIAERLQYFIDEGKKVLESKIDLGDFEVKVIWSKGMLPCPFAEPPLHHKILASVVNKKMNKEIQYSQLNVHLIREHGFFEGKGSVFRIEPNEVVEFLNIKKRNSGFLQKDGGRSVGIRDFRT